MRDDRRENFYRERARICSARHPELDGLSLEATFGIFYTYDLLHQIMSRDLAEYGLSKSTLNILMLLKHGRPEGMLLSDLGELMLVSRANITGLIDHLQHKGLVLRVVDSHDRRARFARLTHSGEELIERYAPIHYRSITGFLQELTGDEKETLIALLRKTRSSLRAHSTGRLQSSPEYQTARS